MHLVGFIITIYHDARSSERQITKFYFNCTSTTMMHKSGPTACLRTACGSGENYKILPLKFQRDFITNY